jgi:hypothetical protein
MREAIANGHPKTLHRVSKQDSIENRKASGCPKLTEEFTKDNKAQQKTKNKMSCDEYPFASSLEGTKS